MPDGYVGNVNFGTNNPFSDRRLNSQESEEAIVSCFIGRRACPAFCITHEQSEEGSQFWCPRNYPHEAGVEFRSSVEEPGDALVYIEGVGRNPSDTSRLLEAILDKVNLNQACQRGQE